MINMIRLLRASEIECRVSTIRENGLSLLLYKDARVDQRILDETFTPFGWKRTHQSIDGNLYCTVEIWDDSKKQWIAKQDVGTMSTAEKEKGQASDSFKRACFNVGIGRELYTAPDFIWIPADKANIQEKNNKLVTYERFQVSKIDYNEQREIVLLEIRNSRGTIVYSWSCVPAEATDPAANKREKPCAERAPAFRLNERQKRGLQNELERTGIALEAVLARYQLSSPEEMGADTYKRAMNSLRKTKAKGDPAA